MQLSRLVNFHKVMGDPTRIRIIVLLAKGPHHGQALAGKLGLTPPTITHHISKLKEIGIIQQKREKNTIYFYLDEEELKLQSQAIVNTAYGKVDDDEDKLDEHQQILANFMNREGKLKTIPAQRKKKLIILKYLVKGLQRGKKYTEKEINEYIQNFHEDFATIRREFIMCHFMYRENGIYEVNPPEMWEKIH